MIRKKSSRRQSRSISPVKKNVDDNINYGSDETDFRHRSKSSPDSYFISDHHAPTDSKFHSCLETLESSGTNLEAKDLKDAESDRTATVIKETSEIKSLDSVTNSQRKEKFINLNIRSKRFLVIFFAIPFAIQYLFSHVLSNGTNSIVEYHLNISEKLDELAAKYNQDNDIWMLFEAGIKRAINENSENHNGEIAVFFLTQWSNENDIAFMISRDIGDLVTKYTSQSNRTEATILTPNILNDLSQRELISKYSENLTSSHVLIVPEIEKISSFIAQDLRYICDEENPIIPKLIVFLIMNVKNCRDIDKNHLDIKQKYELISTVEECITEIWGGADGLRPEVLKPLLARIINTVIIVK